MKAVEDPIELYLDRLLLELRGRARDVRRILAETEEHLRDAAAAGVDGGLDETQAAAQAVARFGQARDLARRFASPAVAPRAKPILAQVAASLLLLGALGLLALGASGVLAAGFGLAFGRDFVAGDAPGVTYTAARCAQYRAYEPAAPTCAAAAAAHHFGEVVGNQLAAGILGLLALGVHRGLRRRREPAVGLLPDGFVATVGLSVFGVAGALLLLQGTGQLAFSSGSGTGTMLSQGLVCLVAAAAFLPGLYRLVAVRTSLVSARGPRAD